MSVKKGPHRTEPKECLAVYSAVEAGKFGAAEIFITLQQHEWKQFKCSLLFEGTLCSCCRQGQSSQATQLWFGWFLLKVAPFKKGPLRQFCFLVML